MARWLRALAALPEDLVSVPSTDMLVYDYPEGTHCLLISSGIRAFKSTTHIHT